MFAGLSVPSGTGPQRAPLLWLLASTRCPHRFFWGPLRGGVDCLQAAREARGRLGMGSCDSGTPWAGNAAQGAQGRSHGRSTVQTTRAEGRGAEGRVGDLGLGGVFPKQSGRCSGTSVWHPRDPRPPHVPTGKRVLLSEANGPQRLSLPSHESNTGSLWGFSPEPAVCAMTSLNKQRGNSTLKPMADGSHVTLVSQARGRWKE